MDRKMKKHVHTIYLDDDANTRLVMRHAWLRQNGIKASLSGIICDALMAHIGLPETNIEHDNNGSFRFWKDPNGKE